MDAGNLAAGLTAFLAPALPYLLTGVEEASGALGAKLAEDTWEKAKEIWGRLRPQVEANSVAKVVAADLAQAPDDPDAQAALRLQLKKLLAEDAQLASELARLLESAGPRVSYQAELHGSGAIAQGSGAIAAGERGIAVGGNVRDTVLITGDANRTEAGSDERGE